MIPRTLSVTGVKEWNESELRTRNDDLVGEEPLEIRIGDVALAVNLAREFGMTLIGVLRGRRFVIYSGAEGLAPAAPQIAGSNASLDTEWR